MEPILKDISEILFWYHETRVYQDATLLLDKRDKLSILSYHLAEKLADFKVESKTKQFQRDNNILKSTEAFMKDMAHNKAEMKAKIKHEDIRYEYVESESESARVDILLKQVNKVLDAMQQRISHLKAN